MVRIYNKSGCTKPSTFLMEVFGETCKMYHDGIGCLEQLGKQQRFDADELNKVMVQNSLLSLTEPFQHPRVQGNDYKRIWGKWRGLVRLDRASTYRICPICYLNDLDTKGEAYLRIYHQVQGVLVCAKHKIDLIDIEYELKQLEPIYIEKIKMTRGYSKDKHYEKIAIVVADIVCNNALDGLDSIRCYEKYKKKKSTL